MSKWQRQSGNPLSWLVGIVFVLQSSPSWGQRDLQNIPDPDPELERQTFQVPAGFEVSLYAADPLLAKPIQMNFDDRGRLWIASSSVYPQIKPGQVADDKILVLEDQDQDGVAETTTVFADGLLIPTGVLPSVDGAYVANSTELLFVIWMATGGPTSVKWCYRDLARRIRITYSIRWAGTGRLSLYEPIDLHS